MFLSKFRIQNQSRFRDTGVQALGPRRTAIVGPNNVGKSALLRALAPDSQPIPLRISEDTPDEVASKTSRIERIFDVSQESLGLLCRNAGPFNIVVSSSAASILLSEIRNGGFPDISLSVVRAGSPESFEEGHRLQNRLFQKAGGDVLSKIVFNWDSSSKGIGVSVNATEKGKDLERFLHNRASVSFHRFGAERLAIGASQAAQKQTLNPNCENLAAYLDHIAPNPEWDELQAQLRSIVPSVSRVRVRPQPDNGQIREIVLWTSSAPRSDLAIPLSNAGTGVGQVLAILSVVLTTLEPRLILIDEPNSFLHPGAAKRLLSTFAEDTKHQYVITTHSLETLRWFDPEVVLLLKPNGDITDIEPHSWRDLLSSRVFMSELGISYGDVTGADHCIWVEGQTEAEIFPLIARQFFKSRANTLAFPRVGSTGHFERRSKLSKEEIVEIYDNLSKAVTLLPDTLAFVFDREARSDADRDDLKRRMKDKVEYLPRYCFENYLLEWGAIAETLNEKPTFKAAPTKPADIEAWVTAKAADRKYWPNDIVPKPLNDNNWRVDIRAAELLADMFADLSGGKEKYQKTVDSVAIAKWLLERRPEVFKEIADIIERFLPKSSAR